MTPHRKRVKPERTGRQVPLANVLDKSETVEEKVAEAGEDLRKVNTVLRIEAESGAPLGQVVSAIAQSAEVEHKVQEAAAELEGVNDALLVEIDARLAIEDELSQSQAALAISQVQEKRSRHQAMHDPVTGLPNATLFKDRLRNALAQARRHSWQVAVMFVDLDRFKDINDTQGHDFGDAVLRLVADRLKEFVRGGDTVSRRSGDEFLFLMLEAKSVDNARALAQQIIAVLAAPATVNDVEISVQASIGLAMFPGDGTSVAALLKHADLAMYEAKKQPSGAVPPRSPPA